MSINSSMSNSYGNIDKGTKPNNVLKITLSLGVKFVSPELILFDKIAILLMIYHVILKILKLKWHCCGFS